MAVVKKQFAWISKTIGGYSLFVRRGKESPEEFIFNHFVFKGEEEEIRSAADAINFAFEARIKEVWDIARKEVQAEEHSTVHINCPSCGFEGQGSVHSSGVVKEMEMAKKGAAVKALEMADKQIYEAMTAKPDDGVDGSIWDSGIQYARMAVRALADRVRKGEEKI